jgi:hypothetical protein
VTIFAEKNAATFSSVDLGSGMTIADRSAALFRRHGHEPEQSICPDAVTADFFLLGL